jgi:hypothetical protein
MTREERCGMKRSKALGTALALVLAFGALAGAARRGEAIGDPDIFPELTGHFRGAYQSVGNPDIAGALLLHIADQQQGRLMGTLMLDEMLYEIRGTVSPAGHATIVGFVPQPDPPGAMFVLHLRALYSEGELIGLFGSYQFTGPGRDYGMLLLGGPDT